MVPPRMAAGLIEGEGPLPGGDGQDEEAPRPPALHGEHEPQFSSGRTGRLANVAANRAGGVASATAAQRSSCSQEIEERRFRERSMKRQPLAASAGGGHLEGKDTDRIKSPAAAEDHHRDPAEHQRARSEEPERDVLAEERHPT